MQQNLNFTPCADTASAPQYSYSESGRREGPNLVVSFRAGKFCLVGAFEKDLGVTGEVGGIRFAQTPLNDAYNMLMVALCERLQVATGLPDAADAAEAIQQCYNRFSSYGVELFELAERQVLLDSSRHTAAQSVAFSYNLGVILVCRAALGDGTSANPVITMDTHLGGLANADHCGIEWPFVLAPNISHVQRTDRSRGRGYNSSMDNPIDADEAGLSRLVDLMASGVGSVSLKTPSALYAPLGDAFRSTPEQALRLLAEAVTELKQHVFDERQAIGDEFN